MGKKNKKNKTPNEIKKYQAQQNAINRYKKNMESYQKRLDTANKWKQKMELDRKIIMESDEYKKKRELREQELQKLPQIDCKEFVVRRATFKCMHNDHHTEDIDAAISIVNKNGQLEKVKISAGYCKECQIYFIMESTYQYLKKLGVPICRISDEKSYFNETYLNGMELAPESILMQHGYNVSQNDNLSEIVRHKILAVLIDNKIMHRSDIISYLDFFISQRQYQSRFEMAISKWEIDREFVLNYRVGQYTTYGVNGIYRF